VTALALGAVILMPAAAPGGGPGDDLFPATQGSSWTYSGTAGRSPLNEMATISSAKKAAGKTNIVIRWTKNGRALQEGYEVTASGVAQTNAGSTGQDVFIPPLPIIQYPMKIGKTWNWKGKNILGGQLTYEGTARVRVAAREKVKTPAGVFNAYRVETQVTLNTPGQPHTTSAIYWFAPGVGMVKHSISLPVQSGPGFVSTAALTQYVIK